MCGGVNIASCKSPPSACAVLHGLEAQSSPGGSFHQIPQATEKVEQGHFFLGGGAVVVVVVVMCTHISRQPQQLLEP